MGYLRTTSCRSPAPGGAGIRGRSYDGRGLLMGKFAKTSIDRQFQDQVRDMVQPGTSALFLMLEKVTPDKAVEAMSKYGGTVLKTSLSKDDEKELQDALHGTQGGTQ